MATPITDADLNEFLYGKLDPRRASEVEQALAADPALARRLEGFAADRRRTAMLFAAADMHDVPDVASMRLSEAALMPWRPRLPRALSVWVFLGAALIMAMIWTLFEGLPKGDPLVADALRAAQTGVSQPGQAQAALPVIGGRQVRAPDLARFGLRLDATRVEPAERAVTFTYRAEAGGVVTLFVRPSPGEVRVEMMRRGALRICLWQDDVVTAVLAGHLQAGQMARVAATAFAALSG